MVLSPSSKMLAQIASLLVLAGTAISFPVTDYTVHESRSIATKEWMKGEAVPSSMVLPMRIGLRQSNLENGHDLLMDISDHASPNYGRHYTSEEVTELFAPTPETVDSVRAWLETFGIHPNAVSQSTNKAWLQFDVPAHEAGRLLDTKFHYFEHAPSGSLNIACDEYSIPENLKRHIDYITPGVKLAVTNRRNGQTKRDVEKRFSGPNSPVGPIIRKPLPANYTNNATDVVDSLSKCSQAITPTCVRALYNIPLGDKKASNNRLGIYESGDFYSQKDLDEFFTRVFPQIPAGTGPTLKSVDGGEAPVSQPNAGGESDLDFQLAYPIVWPQGIDLFQVDDAVVTSEFEKQGLFNTFLDAVDGSYCSFSYDGETGDNPTYDPTYPDTANGGYKGQLQCGAYKPPNVISISYGINEADYSEAYQKRQCQEWMKLGLQGVSVVLASGDSGVGGRIGQNGHSEGCLGSNQTIYNPDYPGTCPYITVVGATYLPPGASVTSDAEVAVQDFGSGGGFSNIYSTPSYQANAVSGYFSTVGSPVNGYKYYNTTAGQSVGANGGIYNRAGRGYPDVAAVGDNIYTVVGGMVGLEAGTSASAPIFAAILNRINEERLAAGKKTIGFVNPVLYKNPQVFNDITSGSNPACGSAGFLASKGWDPVTGLGTPKFPALQSLFMSLP